MDIGKIRQAALSIELEARKGQGEYANRDTCADHLAEVELLARSILIQLNYARRAIRNTNPVKIEELKTQVRESLILSDGPDHEFRQEYDEESTNEG